MSVIEIVAMPNQPTTGEVKYVSLGGDGFYSPTGLIRFTVQNTGDASGGTQNIVMQMPDNYTSIVSWGFAQQSDATPISMQMAIAPDNTMAAPGITMRVDNIDGYSGSNEAFADEMTFVPPAIMLTTPTTGAQPSFSMSKVNADGQTLLFAGEIYLFNRRAWESGRAADMFASIGRGGSRFFSNA